MSSLLDVQNALASVIGGIVYPNGESQASIINKDVAIYPGSPTPTDLDNAMAAGTAIISIDQLANYQRNVTRFPRQWQIVSINDATLTATVAGQTLTISGAVSTPQSVMAIVNNQPYAYLVQSNDTLNSIATNLGALIPGATVLNNTITVAGSHSFIARIGVAGVAGKEVMRIETVIMFTIFAANSLDRNTLAEKIKQEFADESLDFLPMADSYPARIQWMGERDVNDSQKANIYRRTLNYKVEYPTVKTETQHTITYPYVRNLDINP